MNIKSNFKNVYLMYEDERRELKSRIFCISKLIRHCDKLFLFQHSEIAKIAVFYEPGIVFIKSSSYQFDKYLFLMKSRGFEIYQWQEEGLHFDRFNYVPITFSTNSHLYCSKYFAWHPADAKMAEKAGFLPENIEIVGNMRFELLSAIQHKPKEISQNCFRILLLTNFDTSGLNAPVVDTDSDTKRNAMLENFHLLEKINLAGSSNTPLYLTFISILRESGFSVILRPYFYEKNHLGNILENLRIDANVSIYDTLREVDVLVHYGSTAGIESISLGVPSLILSKDLTTVTSEIRNVSKTFSNVESILEYLFVLRSNNDFYSQELQKQRDCVNNVYGFNLSNSTQTISMTRVVEQYSIGNVGKHSFMMTRIKLFAKYSNVKFKSRFKSFFRRNHVVKARTMSIDNLTNELKNFISSDDTINIRLLSKGKIAEFSRI